MRIKVNTKVLSSAISDAMTFIPVKSPMEILKYAKVTTKGLRMKVEANNSQSSITKYMDILESDQDGSFLLDAANIAQLLGKIKDENIELDIEDSSVTLKHKRGKVNMALQDVNNYTMMGASNGDKTQINIPAKYLRECVTKAKNFVSQDTIRPQMCAIYAYVEDGEFGYCATDTRKLLHDAYAIDEAANVNFYIMPDVFKAMLSACRQSQENVTVIVTESMVTFNFGTTIIRSAQAHGKYPNFKRVIPPTSNMECEIDKKDLSESLNRISLFSNDTGCIKLALTALDMTLDVDDYASAKSCMEIINHNGCNGELTIGVHVHNLIQALEAVDSNEMVMRFIDSGRPIVIKQKERDNLTALVMPMSLVN